ncbi:MAG: hypothetical protein HZC40_21090, partial [Chloroflexi bacterium]|nr:hypothetical protein [Chloroflexota bacterium]
MQTNRDRIVRFFFGAIAILVIALVGYVVYLQASTPALDCALDWSTGRVLTVSQDSFANYAGLQPGDVILTVEGMPFQQWRNREIENRAVEIRRGDQILTLALPLVPLAQMNLPNLASALIVTLTFWGIGTWLAWRRWREIAARLFFLMTQSIGVGLLFFLAYPQATDRPYWMAVIISIGFHLAGALLVHYYLYFPVALGTARQRAWTLAAIYPGMLLALALRLSFTDLGIRLSFLYNTLEISGAITLSIYSYVRRATPDGRRRLRLVIGGNLAAAFPGFALYLLPTIAGSSTRMPDWMVGPFILISPISYLLAIVRDNLFNIDRILNRTVVFAILSLGILILYLGPFLAIYRFAPGDWLAQTMIAAALTLLVGFAFAWSRTQVQRWVDRFFYGGWYDYPRVVETISAALARSIERAQLSDVLTRQVPELMRLNHGALAIGESPTPPLSHSPALEFPLAFQDETRAIWHVGARRDDEDWSDTDRRILATLARQAEIALGNVLLVEMLRGQLDVIRATQHQLLRSREAERARLARDLHDGPIQDLVGLNMQLGLILTNPGFRASDQEGLTAIRAEVRDLLSELRQVCAELRPPMVDTIGLSAALRVLADEWSSQHGIPVQLDLAPDAMLRALPGEVAVNLYRVAQEALSNVARHAHARTIALHLTFDDARLTLTIRDDGRGFNAPATLHDLPARGHFGLVGLRERVELIGG